MQTHGGFRFSIDFGESIFLLMPTQNEIRHPRCFSYMYAYDIFMRESESA